MKYDTHIQVVPLAEVSSLHGVFRFSRSDSGAVEGIAGLRSLVQRWVKCFLTGEGTDLSDPRYGTNFPYLIRGNVTSPEDLGAAVRIAVSKANATILRYQALSAPQSAAETFEDAVLEKIVIPRNKTSFVAYVRIYNQAGSSSQMPVQGEL